MFTIGALTIEGTSALIGGIAAYIASKKGLLGAEADGDAELQSLTALLKDLEAHKASLS